MTALQHAHIIQEEVEPYRALKYAPDPCISIWMENLWEKTGNFYFNPK